MKISKNISLLTICLIVLIGSPLYAQLIKVKNLEKGLAEMYRVLKPGGKVVILEFSQPTQFPVKQFYNFYSNYVMPRVGQLLSKERSAYEYLPASVAAFPYGKKFTALLTKTGYRDTKAQSLTFGIANIYTGLK